ncbi:hypothetical protein ACFVJH_27405 [Streptomyces decoyicus]|uniref:hypothetical protein n=1 Tax=Streptomyces decoyicus TaxID=249567 RepID=UPI00362FF154
MPKSGVGVTSILLRLPSIQERLAALHNPCQAPLRPIVISLRRPTGTLPPYESQQLGPVVVGLVPDVASVPHGVASELELPCKCPHTSHRSGVVAQKASEVQVLKRVNRHAYCTRERPIVEIHELMTVKATSGLERLLEFFPDGWVTEEVSSPVGDPKHNHSNLVRPRAPYTEPSPEAASARNLHNVPQVTLCTIRFR